MSLKENLVNEIFELSQEFEKNKLWEDLSDSEYFAVEFPDGEIGYVRIVSTDDQKALNLYPSDKALDNIRYLYQLEYYNPLISFENIKTMQDFIQLSLDSSDLVYDENLKAYKEFYKDNEITIKDKIPNLLRYKPHYFPNLIRDEKELEHLKYSLIAQNEVKKALTERNKKDLGFEIVYPGISSKIPLIKFNKNNEVTWDFIKTPEAINEEYDEIIMDSEDDLLLKKVKLLDKVRGIDSAFLTYTTNFFPENDEFKTGAFLAVLPFFGLGFSIGLWTTNDYQIVPLNIMLNPDEDNIKNELRHLAQYYLEKEEKPEQIRVMDKRTANILRDFCKKTGIKLLDGSKQINIKEQYYRELNRGDTYEIIDEILQNSNPGEPVNINNEDDLDEIRNEIDILTDRITNGEDEAFPDLMNLLFKHRPSSVLSALQDSLYEEDEEFEED